MNHSSADDTIALLDQFENLFSRRPDAIRRTQETIGVLYQQWSAEGYQLVSNELRQGQDTLVMSKDGDVRAAIDQGVQRTWGTLS
jgi:hypothetical protein